MLSLIFIYTVINKISKKDCLEMNKGILIGVGLVCLLVAVAALLYLNQSDSIAVEKERLSDEWLAECDSKTSGRDECYLNVAMMKTDISYCDKIELNSKHTECVSWLIMQNNNDGSLCNELRVEDAADKLASELCFARYDYMNVDDCNMFEYPVAVTLCEEQKSGSNQL